MTSYITNAIAYSFGPTSLFSQTYPPPSKFNVSDIPDLTGKVIIVTGCAGIGFETIKACLEHNAKVYVAARSKPKAENAIADLQTLTGKAAIFLPLDLSDLRSVKASAEEFLSKETELDVLFLNAGVMATPMEQLSAQGYDLQFGTNVIGHAYFTKLLLPALSASLKTKGMKPRIVTTSSDGHLLLTTKAGIDFAAIKPGKERDALSPTTLYGLSKLGNVVWTQWMHNHHGDEVVSTVVHPGHIQSELVKTKYWWAKLLVSAVQAVAVYATPYGALTQLYAGLSPETADMGGKYFVPWARDATSTMHPTALDVEVQEELNKQIEQAISGI